jgi:hypothetical protein
VDDRNWRRLRSRGFRFPGSRGDRVVVVGGESKRDWLSTAGQLSAVLAGLAALTYVLGLLVLWVPIARTYTGDLTTAWHAVSLVPRPVVAGLGVGQLLPVPTLTLVGYAAVVLMFASVGWYAVDRWGERAVWWIVGIFAVVVVAVAGVFTELVGSRGAYPFLGAVAASIAFSFIRRFIPGLSHERYQWVVLVVFITVLYVGSAVNVAFSAPPLPPVEISATTKTKGTLLTHTDGFWYVFNREGDLIAVPDDEVKTVRVSSDGD